jgi:hypothetical protein
MNITNRGTVQVRDGSTGPTEEDIGYRGPLVVIGSPVNVQHDLPRGARLYPVKITNRHDYLQVGQVGPVGVALVDVP